jgi:hypothetical protein
MLNHEQNQGQGQSNANGATSNEFSPMQDKGGNSHQHQELDNRCQTRINVGLMSVNTYKSEVCALSITPSNLPQEQADHSSGCGFGLFGFGGKYSPDLSEPVAKKKQMSPIQEIQSLPNLKWVSKLYTSATRD